MIICAAIKIEHIDIMGNKLEPLIVCGHRHGDCLKISQHLNLNIIKKVQGFINHKGEFLDRKEALSHALECGQLSKTNRWYQEDQGIEELYSEDLY